MDPSKWFPIIIIAMVIIAIVIFGLLVYFDKGEE